MINIYNQRALHSSSSESEGRLYFTSERGTVFVVKPGADFTALAINQMSEVYLATPATSEGTIFFARKSQWWRWAAGNDWVSR